MQVFLMKHGGYIQYSPILLSDTVQPVADICNDMVAFWKLSSIVMVVNFIRPGLFVTFLPVTNFMEVNHVGS